MAWTTFFAASDDFAPLLGLILNVEGATLFEVYSRLGHEARAVTTPDDAIRVFCLGIDPNGQGVAAHCALWVPAVMPAPTRKRINLTTGNWRETIEGCGLFWLQAGGVHGTSVTESRFGWFTEAGARAKCDVTPSGVDVAWKQHSQVASTIKKALRSLGIARARRFPVLAHAARLHSEGHRLLYGAGIKRELSLDAA